jgi:hypothetical protein
LESLQCGIDDASHQSLIVVRCESWITAHVLDAYPAYDAIRTRVHGQNGHGGDLNHRNSQSFDLLADRCAATIAAPSSCHQEHCLNLGL